MQLRQQISYVDEVIVKDLSGDIEKAENLRITSRVVDVLPFFAAHNDVALPEDGKLLGKGGLLYGESGAEFVDADFPVAESFEKLDPQRVGKGLEKLGCEVGELRHIYIYEY